MGKASTETGTAVKCKQKIKQGHRMTDTGISPMPEKEHSPKQDEVNTHIQKDNTHMQASQAIH